MVDGRHGNHGIPVARRVVVVNGTEFAHVTIPNRNMEGNHASERRLRGGSVMRTYVLPVSNLPGLCMNI